MCPPMPQPGGGLAWVQEAAYRCLALVASVATGALLVATLPALLVVHGVRAVPPLTGSAAWRLSGLGSFPSLWGNLRRQLLPLP